MLIIYYYIFSCEHYSRSGNRDHYIDSYDVDYLEAYFFKDMAGLNRIETTAALDGYGPLSACTTSENRGKSDIAICRS